MAELICYDTNTYATPDLYGVLKAIPNFWDETDDEASSLTKGGITLTVSSTTKSISGYGKSEITNLGSSTSLIAATENGLVFFTSGTVIGIIAIGCDKNGNWAGVYSQISSGNPTVNKIVADGVSSTTYSSQAQTVVSTVNTQIVDLTAVNGNFTFDDVKRVLFIPVLTYLGKLTMPNGEKFVKCGALALRYTE